MIRRVIRLRRRFCLVYDRMGAALLSTRWMWCRGWCATSEVAKAVSDLMLW